MKFKFDVIVIGASLSGSSAALHLADAGRTICLIDKANFPRPKSCGEGLSPQGAAIIRTLGLSKELTQAPHQPLCGYTIHWGQTIVSIPYAQKNYSLSDCTPEETVDNTVEFGLGIKRQILDEMLVTKCRDSKQITFFDKSPVRSITSLSDGFDVEISTNKFHARRLVIADGANSPSSRLLAIPSTGRTSPKKSAFTCGYRGSWSKPIGHVHILNYTGIRLFITPVGNNEVSVALLAAPHAARILSSATKRDLLISNAFQVIGFTPGELLQSGGSSNIGHHRRPAQIGGAYLVGDAVEQLDPVGGMGMTHALFSGKFAAEALASDLAGAFSPKEAGARYQAQREAAVIPLRGFTRMVDHVFFLSEYLPLIRPLLGSAMSVSASREVHQLKRILPFSGLTAKCLLYGAGYL